MINSLDAAGARRHAGGSRLQPEDPRKRPARRITCPPDHWNGRCGRRGRSCGRRAPTCSCASSTWMKAAASSGPVRSNCCRCRRSITRRWTTTYLAANRREVLNLVSRGPVPGARGLIDRQARLGFRRSMARSTSRSSGGRESPGQREEHDARRPTASADAAHQIVAAEHAIQPESRAPMTSVPSDASRAKPADSGCAPRDDPRLDRLHDVQHDDRERRRRRRAFHAEARDQHQAQRDVQRHARRGCWPARSSTDRWPAAPSPPARTTRSPRARTSGARPSARRARSRGRAAPASPARRRGTARPAAPRTATPAGSSASRARPAALGRRAPTPPPPRARPRVSNALRTKLTRVGQHHTRRVDADVFDRPQLAQHAARWSAPGSC